MSSQTFLRSAKPGALVLLLALAAPKLLSAQQPFTPEIALEVRSPGVAALSADGRFAAVTYRSRMDRTGTDHGRFGDPTYVSSSGTRLAVIETASGDKRWVEPEPLPLRGFSWSPDGRYLAYFASERIVDDPEGEHGPYKLRIYDAHEDEKRTVGLGTEREVASTSPLDWSPEGAELLIGLRPEGWAERAREAFRGLTTAAVIVQDSRNDFLAWDRVRNLANLQETVLVSVADGAVRDLVSEHTPQGVGFSEDGSYVTYSTTTRTRTSYTRRDGTEYELFRLDLAASATPESLRSTGEERTSVSWNPARDAFAFTERGSVFVRRLDEPEAVDVTAAHGSMPAEERDDEAGDDDPESEADSAHVRYSVERWSPGGGSLLLSSEDAWHLLDLEADAMRDLLDLGDSKGRPNRNPVAWSADGSRIYFTWSATDRWERGLKRLDTSSGAVETLVLDENLYGSWRFSDDGGTIVYSMSDGDRPADLWANDGEWSNPMRLTDANPRLAEVSLTRSELVEYLDVDGNNLYGILYYPANYRPGTKYPLVAEIYEQFFNNGFNENMNLITSQGWFGFRPSVRFEEGYPGEAWLKAVPNAINKIVERGLVDPEKVGVYGQSYGGYATNLLITQTDRFAAAANVSGKVNIISFLGDSPKITTRNYAAAEVGQDRIGATLWEQPHKYVDHSAVMFADRIETPLLMLSGEGDWNVPATNQREMYYALRRLGKEVVWVHYTAGGHGAGRASTAADFVDHWQRMFDWFGEHFGEEPPIG